MDWGKWGRKAGIGALVAAGLGGLAALTISIEGVQANPNAPMWVAALAPFSLHLIGLAQNWLKHRD